MADDIAGGTGDGLAGGTADGRADHGRRNRRRNGRGDGGRRGELPLRHGTRRRNTVATNVVKRSVSGVVTWTFGQSSFCWSRKPAHSFSTIYASTTANAAHILHTVRTLQRLHRSQAPLLCNGVRIVRSVRLEVCCVPLKTRTLTNRLLAYSVRSIAHQNASARGRLYSKSTRSPSRQVCTHRRARPQRLERADAQLRRRANPFAQTETHCRVVAAHPLKERGQVPPLLRRLRHLPRDLEHISMQSRQIGAKCVKCALQQLTHHQFFLLRVHLLTQ
eukprot:4853165-Pleurochrysis_carterae.AAC.12